MNKLNKLFLFLIISLAFLINPKKVFADEKIGQVYIKIENTTFDTIDGAPWKNVLAEGFVDIYENSTGLSATIDFCKKNNINYEADLEAGYIKSFAGLSDQDGGLFSGWLVRLNNWQTESGISQYSVIDNSLGNNDYIHWLYTNIDSNDSGSGYGEDLGYFYTETEVGLKDIKVSNGFFDKEIKEDELEYTLTVPKENTKVKLDVVATNTKYGPTIKVDDKYLHFFDEIDVETGKEIIVTINDKNHYSYVSDGETKVYTITLLIEGEELPKSYLLKSINFTNGSLTSDFNKNTFDYKLDVINSDVISIDYKLEDKNNEIKIYLNDNLIENYDDILINDKDILKITVDAVNTYLFEINKIYYEKSDTRVAKLDIINGKLDTIFDKDLNFYNLNVDEDIDKITIIPTLSNEKFNVGYYYSGKLMNNFNDIEIINRSTLKIIINDPDLDNYFKYDDSSIYEFKINKIKESNYSIEEIIKNSLQWQINNYSIDQLINDAGHSNSDWFIISSSRFNDTNIDYNNYISILKDYIDKAYSTSEKLSKNKSTEWARIILAINSLGLEASNFYGYNLISDGTYNRKLDNINGCGAQGINGWIYALIAVDSKSYEIPKDAIDNREEFIVQILNKQLEDGGFALTGNKSDVDITAMAINSLAPYYNSEIAYSYTSTKIKDENNEYIKLNKKIRKVIDESLDFLSKSMRDDGDFDTYGNPNCESVCQVLNCLVSLGIDPLKDNRFIKNNKTIIDGLMKYYNPTDKGFIHSFKYDSNNPEVSIDKSNYLSTSQATYSLINYYRFLKQSRRLFDLNNEFSSEELLEINKLKANISRLDTFDNKSEEYINLIKKCLEDYKNIRYINKSYIHNYKDLYEHAIKNNIEVEVENVEYNKPTSETVLLSFNNDNKIKTESIKNTNSLEYYSDIVELKFIIDNCEDFEDKEYYENIINDIYNKLTRKKEFIDNIKNDILNYLYPFDNITLKDKKIINDIYSRYSQLNDYEKDLFNQSDVEGLMRAKTIIDNLTIKNILLISGIVLVGTLSTITIIRIIKRKKNKNNRYMEESEE